MNEAAIKQCTRCKRVLLRSEFYVDRARIDGLMYCCRSCVNEKQAARHKERLLSDASYREKLRNKRRRHQGTKKRNKEQEGAHAKEKRIALDDGYLCVLIGLPVGAAQTELLRMKRQQIEVYRMSKEIKLALKEQR
jgi:hypothetical protein